MRKIFAAAFLLIWAITPAWADAKNGIAAYRSGDYATALREFRPFARQGHAYAQYNLGVMYAAGRGVPQDYRQAAVWFRKAAEQGYAQAQFNLGVIYEKGFGATTEYGRAVAWYRKAAKKGLVQAQQALGLMYVQGWGVPRDVIRAHAWFSVAESNGHKPAGKFRETVAEFMTPAQIAGSRQLVGQWAMDILMPPPKAPQRK